MSIDVASLNSAAQSLGTAMISAAVILGFCIILAALGISLTRK
jgi:hypothetical protein